MSAQLSAEAVEQLRRYVEGELSNDQLDDWLTGAEYDPALSEAERNALAQVRLVLIEAEEGKRSPADIVDAAARLLATEGEPVIVLRSASTTSASEQVKLTATPTPVQRVSI